MGNITESTLSGAEDTPAATETVTGNRSYTNGGNLVATVTDANGWTTTQTYGTNLSKMLGAVMQSENAKGVATNTNYYSDGRVNMSWITSTIAVTRNYDENDRLTELIRGGYNTHGPDATTPQRQHYYFDYDAFGNTTSITLGENDAYNLGAYSYSPNDGLLTGMTYGNGATVSYTYDDYGRKTQTATSSGDSYTSIRGRFSD